MRRDLGYCDLSWIQSGQGLRGPCATPNLDKLGVNLDGPASDFGYFGEVEISRLSWNHNLPIRIYGRSHRERLCCVDDVMLKSNESWVCLMMNRSIRKIRGISCSRVWLVVHGNSIEGQADRVMLALG